MKCVKMLVAVALVAAIVPLAHGQQPGEQQKLTRDQLRAAVQQICPVSGNRLGVHGAPVKVQVGQETVFLCCKGCAQGKVDPQHWATIHANIARAQGKCPVMHNNLPQQAKWTIVDGQVVYVCCPPCIKKLEADPQTYLKKVDEYYAESLKDEQPSK